MFGGGDGNSHHHQDHHHNDNHNHDQYHHHPHCQDDHQVEEVKEENRRLSVAMKKLKEKQGDKESNIEVKFDLFWLCGSIINL